MKLSRAKLESLADPLLSRTREPCRNCLKDAGVKKEEIDDVLLVGYFDCFLEELGRKCWWIAIGYH